MIESLQRIQPDGTFTSEVGRATVDIFNNGLVWVISFFENGRNSRLTLGHDLQKITALRDAFERALFGFHSLSPMLFVGGVAFNVAEARAMRDLLALALRQAQDNRGD